MANKLKPDHGVLRRRSGGRDSRPGRGFALTPRRRKSAPAIANLNCTTDPQCNQRCSGDNFEIVQASGPTRRVRHDHAPCSTSFRRPPRGSSPTARCVVDPRAVSPGEQCVSSHVSCSTDADCGGAPGSCVMTAEPQPRGQGQLRFRRRAATVVGRWRTREGPGALTVWRTRPDDDAANGYCNRNDSLNGTDKGISCTSAAQCEAAGGIVCERQEVHQSALGDDTRHLHRERELWNLQSEYREGVHVDADCLATEGTCTAAALGTCSVHIFDAGCTKPDAGVDEYVQLNGPGRNYGIQVSNGPDMRFTHPRGLLRRYGRRLPGRPRIQQPGTGHQHARESRPDSGSPSTTW